MLKQILKTNDQWEPLIMRVFLGIVLFPHGMQKLLGWFGGAGFAGTMEYFTGTVGLPWIVGFLTILLESFGSIALIAGIGTRFFALSFSLLAVGIVFTSHIQYGFFMNWYGDKAGEGIEYFLLWLGLSIALAIAGGGKYALDRLILRE